MATLLRWTSHKLNNIGADSSLGSEKEPEPGRGGFF